MPTAVRRLNAISNASVNDRPDNGGATDDHGSYRLFGLRPCQYIVSAEVGGASATADLPGYARTLFPGAALAAQAQFVTIGQTAEVTGIDFGLVRAPTATVSGVYVNQCQERSDRRQPATPAQPAVAVCDGRAGRRKDQGLSP